MPKPNKFSESGLVFQFDKNWVVKKYDDHRFYKRVSGAGLKGIDFISASNQEPVILWEVKNYVNRHPSVQEENRRKLLEETEEFISDMVQKVEDTFVAINAIHKYYMRRWWFKLLYPIFYRFPIQKSDWIFWNKINVWIEDPKNVVFYLWLEAEEVDQDYIQEQLQDRLETWALQVRVINLATPLFPNSIQVKKAET